MNKGNNTQETCDICGQPVTFVARNIVTHDFGEYKYPVYGDDLYKRCDEHKIEAPNSVVKGDISILPEKVVKRLGEDFINDYNKNKEVK